MGSSRWHRTEDTWIFFQLKLWIIRCYSHIFAGLLQCCKETKIGKRSWAANKVYCLRLFCRMIYCTPVKFSFERTKCWFQISLGKLKDVTLFFFLVRPPVIGIGRSLFPAPVASTTVSGGPGSVAVLSLRIFSGLYPYNYSSSSLGVPLQISRAIVPGWTVLVHWALHAVLCEAWYERTTSTWRRE